MNERGISGTDWQIMRLPVLGCRRLISRVTTTTRSPFIVTPYRSKCNRGSETDGPAIIGNHTVNHSRIGQRSKAL